MLFTWLNPVPAARGLPALCATAVLLVAGACTDPTVPFSTPALAPPGPSAERTGIADNAKLQALAFAHKANPTDPAAALAYARALRATGAKAEALSVLDTAAKGKAADRRLTLERGLLALDLGDAAKAETLLRAAHDPKAPDWRLHSGLGAALASRGKQPEAQAQFAKALALAPNHPAVLNNLAISYALDGKAAEAEKVLRTAAAAKASPDAPKVRQNLALVLGLGGKYDESRSVGASTLSPDQAKANVAYLQKLAEARTAGWAPTTQPAEKEAARKSASAAAMPPPAYQLGARWEPGE
jgi:Flp pilus assembly protein TadD